MIRYLFFDLDDTLLDFHASERVAILRTFSAWGIPATEENADLYSGINRDLWHALERGEVTRDRLRVLRFEKLLSAIGREDLPAAAVGDTYEENLSTAVVPMPGAVPLLESLFGKYRMYLVSNGIVRTQERRLDLSGIRRYFDGYFISERLGAHKPDKRYFDLVFDTIENFRKEEAVIIGDSLTSDILGGKHAGIATVLFAREGKIPAGDVTPDAVVTDLSQVPSTIINLEKNL